MNRILALISLATLLGAFVDRPTRGAERHPNIVVILTDDQGYADISFNPHHPPEVFTPHMDALAREGVFFSNGYISGQVCSPTRAGLMLGRYQQRVGVYTAGDGGRGFDPTIPIFPAFLPDEYVSTAIGKWHLGLDEDYPELKWHPLRRGFDECYLFMGRGAHDYFRLKGASGTDDAGPIYRGLSRIDDEGYLTTRLTEEAVAFIERHKQQPFFLYLAYNAVHSPQQAPNETIERMRRQFPDLSPDRQILMAMLHHLDEGIGAVVQKLKQEQLFDNTLLFFLTDNGGAKGMSANNAPLRGYKSSYYEGGIRTPFIVSWPDRFGGGRTIDTPVISLDILPTTLEAVGAAEPAGLEFDGKSLLPLLAGEATTHHPVLYWSNGREGEWAVRRENWKLHVLKGKAELFDLAADPGEAVDLSGTHPQLVDELTAAYKAWLVPMPPGIVSGNNRWESEEGNPLTPREQKRLEMRRQRMAERKAAKSAPPAPSSND